MLTWPPKMLRSFVQALKAAHNGADVTWDAYCGASARLDALTNLTEVVLQIGPETPPCKESNWGVWRKQEYDGHNDELHSQSRGTDPLPKRRRLSAAGSHAV